MTKAWPLVVACLAALIGGALMGVVIGASYQAHADRDRFLALITLPEGELTYTTDPPLIWQKTGNRILAYRPIPTREDIRVSHDFGVPFTPPPVTTTTTTMPKKEKRP